MPAPSGRPKAAHQARATHAPRFAARLHAVVGTVLLAFLLGACDPPVTAPVPTPTPTPTPVGVPSSTPTPTATPSPEVTPSPIMPPTRAVEFRVMVPANTPADEPVSLMLQRFTDMEWSQRIPLTSQGNGLWTGVAELEDGSLTRYVYDRWDGIAWGDEFKATREAHGAIARIESRFLLVTPDIEVVDDIIETWNDHRAPTSTGMLTGLVVDAATGDPLVDTEVAVGGIHVATDVRGEFRVAGLAAGAQRLVVHRTLGDYQPTQATVRVPASGTAHARIELQAARPVEVTFSVRLPEATPADAEIRLIGSVFQMGARPGHVPNTPLSAGQHHLPVMERVASDRAELTLQLHEGSYVQYFYSLGSIYYGREYEGNDLALRGFRVGGAARETRHDEVSSWRPDWLVQVALRVTTPPGTDTSLPLAYNAGPTTFMTQLAPHEWVVYLYGLPGTEFRYRYLLGDEPLGVDGSPGVDAEGYRTLIAGDDDAVVEQHIEQWRYNYSLAAPEPGAPATVTFRVAVPQVIPSNATVRIVGNDPALDDGVVMQALPGNPWVYHATVLLTTTGRLQYHYELGPTRTSSGRAYVLEAPLSGKIVNDWVTVWNSAPAAGEGTRPGFITGVFTPDLWSPSYLALSESTYRRIAEHHGGWVALSSVWSYEELAPVPVVGARSVKAPSVLTPREDLFAQAAMARDSNLHVFLMPQFNMEMTPNREELDGTHSAAWWDAWLGEAERLWLWNAQVAEEIEAELLILPGYFFHVFGADWAYPDAAYRAHFDEQMADLVARVREVYNGKVLMSGGSQYFDFPGLADYVGITTYDTGHPDLPANATVEAWRDAYDTRFAQTVDVLYQRHGKPVVFYTVHVPSAPSLGDPTGELRQARQLEGFFQALEERPWVTGTFTWTYAMVDAPLEPSDGVRGRIAEAVQAKYYGQYTGR